MALLSTHITHVSGWHWRRERGRLHCDGRHLGHVVARLYKSGNLVYGASLWGSMHSVSLMFLVDVHIESQCASTHS